MKFKSKIDWWFYLVAIVCFLVPIFLFLSAYLTPSQGSTLLIIIGAFILFIDVLVILPCLLFTSYTLKESVLHVRSGLCCNRKIPYSNVKSVKETREPWASAALSLDRLEIQYSTGLGVVYISPKDKQLFIEKFNHQIAQAV